MTNPFWAAGDAAALRAAGRLAALQAELARLEAALRGAPLWQPGQSLLAQIAWCRNKVHSLEASWGEKLVVALVGPSGAGKSTLLNALAGRELSPVGLTRPTTRQVVIYARSLADVEALQQHCGPDLVQVQLDHQAPALEYLVLVDTPDTNTLPENQRLLARVLERADVLLTILPAQNPKLLDNIAFLRPYVAQLPADAVVPVVNMVDRVPRQELEEVILPDLAQAIRQEWHLQPERIFLVSAKAALAEATFAEDESPLHNLNQFAALREWLVKTLNRAGQLRDRRLARAEHLVGLVKEQIAQALAETAPARAAAQEALRAVERQAQRDLLNVVLGQMEQISAVDVQAAFYTLLGQRWWGPVGWLVTLWALVLRLGSWVGRKLRPARAGGLGAEPGSAWQMPPLAWAEVLQGRYASDWPPVAEALVQAGFVPAVRGADLWREWATERGRDLGARWGQAMEEVLERLARHLSSWPVTFLGNGPLLALMGWVAYQTVARFLREAYLPLDYFRHAGIAALVLWLLSFVLVQVTIALTLRGPLRRGVARRLQGVAGEGVGALPEQLRALRDLERLVGRGG